MFYSISISLMHCLCPSPQTIEISYLPSERGIWDFGLYGRFRLTWGPGRQWKAIWVASLASLGLVPPAAAPGRQMLPSPSILPPPVKKSPLAAKTEIPKSATCYFDRPLMCSIWWCWWREMVIGGNRWSERPPALKSELGAIN